MPRMTPCRVLKACALPWIVMLGLWFFLPSPAITGENRLRYMQKRLSSGQPVRSVTHERTTCEGCLDMRTGNVFDWQFENGAASGGEEKKKKKDDLLLQVISGPDSTTRLSISDVFAKSRREEQMPCFGEASEFDNVPEGDDSDVINMPWFHVADQILFGYESHGMTTHMRIAPVLVSNDTVEIWDFGALAAARDKYLDEHKRASFYGAERHVYEQLTASERARRVLATFKFPTGDVEDAVVVDVKGDLPSMTFPVRKALMFPLGPIPTIFAFIFGTLLYLIPGFVQGVLVVVAIPFAIVYSGVVVWVWLHKGQPDFEERAEKHYITRWLFLSKKGRKARNARIWGPTGPVLPKHGNGGLGEPESPVEVQRPASVRLGRGGKY